MPFEPHSLQSRLADMCRELGCPPGRDLVEWLQEYVDYLKSQVYLAIYSTYVDSSTIEGELFADGPKYSIDTDQGIEIGFDGYNGKDGGNGIIHIEHYKGEIILRVWADINDEEPTHKISLEGARESNRKDIEE
jgi:hypothetical protein